MCSWGRDCQAAPDPASPTGSPASLLPCLASACPATGPCGLSLLPGDPQFPHLLNGNVSSPDKSERMEASRTRKDCAAAAGNKICPSRLQHTPPPPPNPPGLLLPTPAPFPAGTTDCGSCPTGPHGPLSTGLPEGCLTPRLTLRNKTQPSRGPPLTAEAPPSHEVPPLTPEAPPITGGVTRLAMPVTAPCSPGVLLLAPTTVVSRPGAAPSY